MLSEYRAYLKDNPNGYWFRARLYGWGWTPARWQGWLVIIVYLTLVIFFSLSVEGNTPPKEAMLSFFIPVVILTAMLLRVCYKTGEKPKWNWGVPDKYKKN